MQRPWLDGYRDGVPDESDAARYGSRLASLEESFVRYRRPAYVRMRRRLGCGELDALSQALAGPPAFARAAARRPCRADDARRAGPCTR